MKASEQVGRLLRQTRENLETQERLLVQVFDAKRVLRAWATGPAEDRPAVLAAARARAIEANVDYASALVHLRTWTSTAPRKGITSGCS